MRMNQMTLVTGLWLCVICRDHWDIKMHWHVCKHLTYSMPVVIWHLRNDVIHSHNIQTNILRALRDRSFFYGHNPYSLMYVFIRSCCICKLAHSHYTPHLSGSRIYATYQYNLKPFGSTYLAIKVSFKAKFQIDAFTARWPLMPSFFNQMHM